MARPKKPQVLHVLHGTARPDRDAERADELALPPGSVGECPEWFSVESREEWERLVNDEHYKKVLAPVHRGALIEYCVLYGRMLEDAIGSGDMNSSQRQTLNSLRMQLGLTPASQSKVKGPGEKKKTDNSDPWAALLGKRTG